MNESVAETSNFIISNHTNFIDRFITPKLHLTVQSILGGLNHPQAQSIALLICSIGSIWCTIILEFTVTADKVLGQFIAQSIRSQTILQLGLPWTEWRFSRFFSSTQVGAIRQRWSAFFFFLRRHEPRLRLLTRRILRPPLKLTNEEFEFVV